MHRIAEDPVISITMESMDCLNIVSSSHAMVPLGQTSDRSILYLIEFRRDR